MSFTNAITSGIAGFLATGNPLAALGAAFTGATQNGTGLGNTVNNNNGQQLTTGQLFTNAEQAIQNDQLSSKLALDWQSDQFNKAVDERSEIMRETNTLRDISMEQRKADIAIEKELIKSIG